ncbi:MAG: hypothetical protein MI864_21055, partial [Pseudomonadales bacterium]|nr:hypothetical protein [Pseudomonadales bacterium]
MKRPVFLQLVLLFVFVILSFSSGAMAKEKILWVKWKLVPEYIEDGEFANQGYLDKFLADTIKRFPEYVHSTEFQSISRLDRSWDSGNVCTVHLWLGYWPDKILYSKPYGFTPRFGIVTQRDSELAKRYADKESVSLKALLDDTDFQVGMLPLMIQGTDNSRYPQLKSTLLARMNNGNIKEFSNSRNEMSVEYLDRGRVDY